MNEITDVKEVQQIELDILKDVHAFCRDRSIQYFLCGGTLLGAVRHKGFIPWDDDIDIGMLRPDYERFIREYKSARYGLRCLETNTYTQAFAKVVDTRTLVDERGTTLKNMGVWIDVFPFDGAPQQNYCPMKTRTWRFVQEIILTRNIPLFERGWSWRRHCLVLALLPVRLLPNRWLAGILKKIAMRHSSETSPFIGGIVWGYGEKEILPRNIFSGVVPVRFEDLDTFAMSGWRDYLTSLYGDYMTPPPPEKRKSSHRFKAWSKS